MRTLSAAVIGTLILSGVFAQQRGPFELSEIEELMALSVSDTVLVSSIRSAGIAFVASPEILGRLELLGASNAVVEAIRAAPSRPREQKVPAQPSARTGAPNAPSPTAPAASTGTSASGALSEGRRLADTGRYQEAVAAYTRALNLQPDFTAAYVARSDAWFHLGDYGRTLQDCRKALGLDPKNASAYNNCGVAYNRLKDTTHALEIYNKGIEIDPKQALLYTNRGALFLQTGDFAKARADLGRAIQLAPSVDLYVADAAAAVKLQAFREAVADCDKGMLLDPQNWKLYYYRGSAELGLRLYRVALEDMNRAVELNPKNADSYQTRAAIFKGLGNGAAAKADYERARSLEANARSAPDPPRPAPLASSAPPVAPAAAGGAGSPDTMADVEFWRAVQNDSDPESVALYLKQFPNGIFSALARQRLATATAAAEKARIPATACVLEYNGPFGKTRIYLDGELRAGADSDLKGSPGLDKPSSHPTCPS